MLLTRANARALEGKQSRVSVRPALGFHGGNVVVEAGPGLATLVIPVGNDRIRTFSAVLTELTPRPHVGDENAHRADVAFVSSAQTASYAGSLTGPGAAACQVGRRPFRTSPYNVNWLTTSTGAPTSEADCSSRSSRSSQIFRAVQAISAGPSPWVTPR